MKKSMKILFTAAMIGCMLSFPAAAAETKAEYKEELAPIRAEIQEIADEMESIREENQTLAAAYKAVRLSKKETGTLSVDKDVWKEAKELRSQIKEIKNASDASDTKALRQEAKNAVENQDFDLALENMNQVLEQKKAKLETLKQVNALWKEIDALLEE